MFACGSSALKSRDCRPTASPKAKKKEANSRAGRSGARRLTGIIVEPASQNPIPIAVLLTLAVFFLYLHFTNGSSFLRLMLAGALVVSGLFLLLPSFPLDLPAFLDNIPKN